MISVHDNIMFRIYRDYGDLKNIKINISLLQF